MAAARSSQQSRQLSRAKSDVETIGKAACGPWRPVQGATLGGREVGVRPRGPDVQPAGSAAMDRSLALR